MRLLDVLEGARDGLQELDLVGELGAALDDVVEVDVQVLEQQRHVQLRGERQEQKQDAEEDQAVPEDRDPDGARSGQRRGSHPHRLLVQRVVGKQLLIRLAFVRCEHRAGRLQRQAVLVRGVIDDVRGIGRR